MNEEGFERDARGDPRVSVTVATNPTSEAQESRGLGRASPHIRRLQVRVECAVHLGHEQEQRLVEDPHEGADLVKRLQFLAS